MVCKILKLIKYFKNQLIIVNLNVNIVWYYKDLLLLLLLSFVSTFILSVLIVFAVLLILIEW